MKYSYLIIEDNPKAVESLKLFLNQFENYIEAGTSCSVKKGVNLILEQKPDLVFIDVELTDGKGFEIINEIKKQVNQLPIFIMITSHDHYAKEALNNDVFYYISKPFDPDELEIALHKFQQYYINNLKHISIKTSEGLFKVDINKLLMIASDANYSYIYKTDSSFIYTSKTIKEFISILPEKFIRIHKSYIVNMDFIELMSIKNMCIVLKIDANTNPIKNFVYEKEKTEFSELIKNNKTIKKSYEDHNKIILPIGRTYLEKLKNRLF